ncbi:MAG: ribosome maturation factor RimP [Gammaproteobacteria bacterium]|nr:ribosome maturation factor RimP [Gammaproteobacteria bacterium]
MGLEITARLRQLLEPAVALHGCELVAVEYVPQGNNQTLRVYIDKQDGVTVHDCERVSHQISGVLDVEDPIAGHYMLEVSSPGLDRPLSAPRDFERFRGSEIRLRLHAPLNGQRNFKGLLMGLRGEQVVLEVDGREIELPLRDVDRARLVPDI